MTILSPRISVINPNTPKKNIPVDIALKDKGKKTKSESPEVISKESIKNPKNDIIIGKMLKIINKI